MKVAICGAGVAGPCLAYWLDRAGHEPTLIEQASALRAGGYMIDFWGVGYTVAERMGILPAVHEAGYNIEEVGFVDDRGRKAGGFKVDGLRGMVGDRFVSLPRGDLAAEIYRSLGGRVETLLGDTVVAVDDDGRGVRVGLASGGERTFDLLVGADGQHSAVRRLVFGPQAQFERRIGYCVAAFETEGYRPRNDLVYVSHARPGRQVARFALRGDRTMFLFVFAAERLDGEPPHDLAQRKAALSRVFEDMGWECPQILAAMQAAPDLYFDDVSQIIMPAWSKGRVALVGDAAACVSLLAGEGTGLGMTEAYVLAGELQAAGGDHVAAFQRYESRLRPLIAAKQKSARNFAGSFAPRTALGLWFRNQVTKLMALPGVARLTLAADIQDKVDLPDYWPAA